MKDKFEYEKGGNMSKNQSVIKNTTYVSNRDIKELELILKGELKKISGKDIIDGVYVRNKKTNARSSDDAATILAYLKKTIEEEKDYLLDEFNLDISDIKSLLEVGFNRKDIEVLCLGYGFVFGDKIQCDNEFGSDVHGLLSSSKDYQKKIVKNVVANAKDGFYVMGLKYPSFTWNKIVQKYSISLKAKYTQTEDRKYEFYSSKEVALGRMIAYKDFKNKWSASEELYADIDLKKPNSYQKSRGYDAGFNGGYWGVVTKSKEVLYDILGMMVSQKDGYVKDLEVFQNGLGGIDTEAVKGKFKDGGMTESDTLVSIFDNLKKGDKIKMSYGDAIVGNATKDLVVKNRTRVGVGKSWESDKITFTNLNNPSGVKLYGYKRMNNNAVSFAIGDMGIWDVKITKLGQYQMGGNLNTFTYTIGGL